MKNILYVLSVAGLTVALCACGGGGNGNNSNSSGSGSGSAPPPASQPPSGVDFTAFVKENLQGTSDTKDPLPINSLTFQHNDGSNPKAYDDTLGTGS